MSSLFDIASIDWDQAHFLRPWALWGILIFTLLTIAMIGLQREQQKWRNLISKSLQKWMFTPSSKRAILSPLISFWLTGVLLSIAVAGPTWRQIEVPGMKSTSNLMILLDLSWSMMAEDIQPTRLERAKLKINDLLDANPGAPVSLMVYAKTLHPVLPLTTDYEILRYNTEYLKCTMMPVFGDDLPGALATIDTLFDRFVAPSTLLLITDEVDEASANVLRNFVESSSHSVDIMLMSSSAGAPVPGFRPNTTMKDESGDEVVSRQDMNVLANLSAFENIRINPLTLDNSDVTQVADRIRSKLEFQAEDERQEDQWQDEGLVVLLPALFLGMLFFRKGWMVQWCLILLTCNMGCSPSNPYADWWYTPDYKAQLLEQDGRYDQAAQSYSSLQHKAVAFYKARDYEAAASLFAQDTSALGYYNLALSMAQLGDYDAALAAIEQADKMGAHISNLKQTTQLIEDQRASADSVQRFNPEVLEKANEEQGPLVERTAKGKDEELTSGTEVEELPESGERVTDEVASNMSQAEELERPPENMDIGREEEAQNILLRGISADPSEFLKRRFKFQKEKYYPEVKASKVKW